MSSLIKVFKYAGNVHSNEVVSIPDVDLNIPQSNMNNDKSVKETVPEIDLVEQAQIKAQEILGETQLHCENMIAKAQTEAQSIREQAYQQGYDEAFMKRTDEITSCISNTNQTLIELENSYQNYLKEYSSKLSSFSLEIASSILKTKLNEEPLIMCDLVENVMSNIKEAKWAIVTLSKKLVPLIELLQSELPSKCPTIPNMEIEGKDIELGKLIVDSSVGVIDASIDEQIKNLALRFEQVDKGRGKP